MKKQISKEWKIPLYLDINQNCCVDALSEKSKWLHHDCFTNFFQLQYSWQSKVNDVNLVLFFLERQLMKIHKKEGLGLSEGRERQKTPPINFLFHQEPLCELTSVCQLVRHKVPCLAITGIR